jgi:hypothetical protein
VVAALICLRTSKELRPTCGFDAQTFFCILLNDVNTLRRQPTAFSHHRVGGKPCSNFQLPWQLDRGIGIGTAIYRDGRLSQTMSQNPKANACLFMSSIIRAGTSSALTL